MKKLNVLVLAVAVAITLGGCTNGYKSHHYAGQSGYDGAVTRTYGGVGGSELTRSDIMSIQRSLAAQGYNPGKIDGIWGKNTSRAVRAYQRAHDHRQTGILTDSELDTLGLRYGEYHD